MNDPHEDPAAPARWSFAVAAVAFLFCLALAPAFPGRGDAGEFTLALALRGVPHPTGYPLYVLAGHVWVTLLHGTGFGWAHAANAWSAAGAGVACGLLYALTLRLLPAGSPAPGSGLRLLALLPAGVLLFDRAFLRDASVAEVTTWQLAAVLALTLAVHRALAALARPSEERSERELRRRHLVVGLATGAALSHHATSVFFAVPLLAVLALARARAGRGSLTDTLALCAGAALPMLSWLHLAWRAWHPAAFQWPLLEPSWTSVLAHATGRVFTAYLGGFAPRPEEARLLLTAVAPFAAPGLLLGGWLAVRERTTPRGMLFTALLSASLLQLAFVFRYGVPDGVAYFVPVLAVGVLATGVALAPFAAAAANPAGLAAALLALALHAAAGVGWSAEQHRADARVAAAIRERWDALPFERGIVLWNSDHYTHLVILGLLEQRRPGLIVDDPAMLTWEPARRAFERRTGIDPLAGLTLRDDSDLARIAPNVARQGSLPVVDFAVWRP